MTNQPKDTKDMSELLPTQADVTLRFDTASLEDRLLGRECAKRSHDETFDADLLKEAREALINSRQSTEAEIVAWLRSGFHDFPDAYACEIAEAIEQGKHHA